MSGIRLSEKYGVNPTVQKCFWCGGDIGVALLGKLKGDREAPREMVLDYSLCKECEEKKKEYVHLIEAVHEPDYQNQPEIQKDLWPTGRNMWIRDAALINIIHGELAKNIIKSRVAFVSSDVFDLLVKMANEANEANEAGDENATATEDSVSKGAKDEASCDTENQKTNAKSNEVIRSSIYPILARKAWTCHDCGGEIRAYSEFERREVHTGRKLEKRRICKACHEKFVKETNKNE